MRSPFNHTRFYEAPTQDKVLEHGPVLAEIRQRIRAERLGSRLFSATMAVVTGSTLTIIEGFSNGIDNPKDAISNFAVPALVNTVAQLRTERTLKNELKHVGKLAGDVAQQYRAHIQADQSTIELLTECITEAGLEVPTYKQPETP